MASGNGGIFISYRRGETAWPARQLYDVLASRYGTQSVFKDVDDIEPGEDFVDTITAAVASCDVLLALIGPQWLGMTNAQGTRRLDDPEDFVRLELSAALSRGVRVVPILVDGARMPSADELSPDLAALVRRQAVEISPVGFNTERLLTMLDGLLARSNAAPAAGAGLPATPGRDASGPDAHVVPAADEAATANAAQQAPERHPSHTIPTPPESATQEHSPAARSATPLPATQQPPAARSATPLSATQQPSAADRAEPVAGPRPSDGGVGVRPGDLPTSAPDSPRASGSTPPSVAPSTAEPPVTGAERGAKPKLPLLVGAGALAVALIAGVLVWHPWSDGGAGSTAAAGRPSTSSNSTASPVVTASPGVTAGATASDGTSVTSSPARPASALPAPPILAHRGGFEQHQLETLQAMEDAARRGFAVETDVRYTKDGIAVLVHDEAATKGLDCGGDDVRVSRTTWAQLRAQCRSKPTASDPKSYEIPTLDATLEAIAAASPTAWVFLEVKTDETVARLEQLLATPAKYGLSERTVWTSFSKTRLARLHDLSPRARLILFVDGKQASGLNDDYLWAVAVNQSIATPSYVTKLKASGLTVLVWNPNEPQAWAAAAALEPDLVMTDLPRTYQQWLANR